MQAQLSTGDTDQKRVYRDIRNFLAGRVVGATRDEALLDEVVKCLLCKVFLVNGNANGDAHLALAYRDAFDRLRDELHGFDPGEPIHLDDEAIEFVDSQLAKLDLQAPTRDPLGDLYKTFIGSAMRAQEGQFFTPQNAIELLVAMVDPRPGERVLDPASGAGGFLSSAARHLVREGAHRVAVADTLYGLEKDAYLASLAQRGIVVVAAAAPAHIVCGDSLAWVDQQGDPLSLPSDGYDVIPHQPTFWGADCGRLGRSARPLRPRVPLERERRGARAIRGASAERAAEVPLSNGAYSSFAPGPHRHGRPRESSVRRRLRIRPRVHP